jgi:hypothetical protein
MQRVPRVKKPVIIIITVEIIDICQISLDCISLTKKSYDSAIISVSKNIKMVTVATIEVKIMIRIITILIFF